MSIQKKNIMKNKTKIIFNKIPEFAVFTVYIVMHIIVSLKHEHWFDENVAYMIAKYTSVKDILFYVPHYEGHPPLWHLVLKALDCMGLSFETVMIVASTIFTAIAIWLLLMYSPFPKWIKLVLPFTYFLFYQYGIVVRPYCMMMAAFFLMAMTFANRNKKPWRFVLSMIFLCLTSAYGIIISGGICIAWVVEIVRDAVTAEKSSIPEKIQGRSKGWFVKLLSDRRVKSLSFILVAAVLLMIEIMPYPDTHATNVFVKKRGIQEIIDRAVYSFFCIIPDNICYDVYGQSGMQMILVSIIGILMIAVVLKILHKRQLAMFFVVPYILFALFGSAVYMMSHHTGVITLFLIFLMWVAFEKKEIGVGIINVVYERIINYIRHIFKDVKVSAGEQYKSKRMLKIAGYGLIIYVFAIPVYWNIWASVYDIGHVYSDGKATAEFIKSNNLDKYIVMADWYVIKNENGEIEKSYPRITSSYSVIPYLGKNIYAYLEYGCDGNYDIHVQLSEDEEKNIYERWRSIGKPEVIVGDAELSMVFPNAKTMLKDEYRYVFADKGMMVWKDGVSETAVGVYVRNDVANVLGLKEVEKPMVVKTN